MLTGMWWGTGEMTGDGTVDINDLTLVLASDCVTIAPLQGRGGCRAGAVLRAPGAVAAGLVGVTAPPLEPHL